ncbi:MAG TPA: hypothetical protein VM554_09135 [Acidisarcina sp.]|nr:hypothetical protein [Acidisarcina sp.]
MRKNKARWLCLILFCAGVCSAQVVPPIEIQDPQLQILQRQNMGSLKLVGQEILAHRFDFPFYLSRKLDIDEPLQLRTAQSSIRFDRYDNQVVLAISGNYFAAYSPKFDVEQRAKDTLLEVVLPILKIAVAHFGENSAVQGYAVEVSHHIVRKTIGLTMERPENMMTYLPQRTAIALVKAKSEGEQEAAMLNAQVFLNAEPLSIWLSEGGTRTATAARHKQAPIVQEAPLAQTEAALVQAVNPSVAAINPVPAAMTAPKREDSPVIPRDTSKQALAALQTSNADLISRMTKDLNAQAHFVSYAPPAFVAFRQGSYLELSVNTSLPATAAGSHYKLAALAFDDHIAHLIRPLLGYFKGEQEFDGIGISTTVHIEGSKGSASTDSEAVEFFFPFRALHCYESYDCTGQQLIDAGSVLINGERVGVDLQSAEATPR